MTEMTVVIPLRDIVVIPLRRFGDEVFYSWLDSLG